MAKILLSLPDDLLTALDKYCADNHFERSEMVRSTLRLILGFDNMAKKVERGEPLLPRVPDSPKNILKKQKGVFSTTLTTAELTPENTTIVIPKIIKRVEDIPTLSKNMSLWKCSHGVPGKLCKKIACQQEARKH